MNDWHNNLLIAMNDPKYILYEDNYIVIIKDKYPKSDFHYLILPRQNIPNLRWCSYEHKMIIEYMEIKAYEFFGTRHPYKEFW